MNNMAFMLISTYKDIVRLHIHFQNISSFTYIRVPHKPGVTGKVEREYLILVGENLGKWHNIFIRE